MSYETKNERIIVKKSQEVFRSLHLIYIRYRGVAMVGRKVWVGTKKWLFAASCGIIFKLPAY